MNKEVQQIRLKITPNGNKGKKQKRTQSEVECFACHQKEHYKCNCPGVT